MCDCSYIVNWFNFLWTVVKCILKYTQLLVTLTIIQAACHDFLMILGRHLLLLRPQGVAPRIYLWSWLDLLCIGFLWHRFNTHPFSASGWLASTAAAAVSASVFFFWVVQHFSLSSWCYYNMPTPATTTITFHSNYRHHLLLLLLLQLLLLPLILLLELLLLLW